MTTSGPTPPCSSSLPACSLSEVFVVHFEFRRNSHTFSLVERPLVLGLLYARPAVLVPAHIVGAALALVLHRRQRAVKLVFNLASLAVQDSVALAVFSWLSVGGSPLARSTWLAGAVACGAGSLVGILLVFRAMRLSGDLPPRPERTYSLLFGVVATIITTSTAMAMAVLAERDRAATILLVLPVAALYLAHRAYVATRNEHRHVEVLHDSAELLLPNGLPVPALDEMLLRTQAAFGVAVAAMVYRGSESADLTSLIAAPGTEHGVRTGDDAHEWWSQLEALVPDRDGRILGVPGRDGAAPKVLAGVSVRDGMAVALRADDRLFGYLLVVNRLGDVGRFTADDLRVLQTVGRQVVAAVAGTESGISASELRVLDGELRYRARHDGLTGLANVAGLRDRLSLYLASAGAGGAGVLVLEVDGIEAAIDRLGPDTRDKLLLVIAQRIRSSVREDDTPARIDDRRFAVAARTPLGSSDARIIAERLRSVVGARVNIDGEGVALSTTVGVSMNTVGADADTVLVAANSALASAIRRGPGGLEIAESV